MTNRSALALALAIVCLSGCPTPLVITPYNSDLSADMNRFASYVGHPDHYAIDLRAQEGQDVIAAADGVVAKANFDSFTNEGAVVVIHEEHGFATVYGNVDKLLVKEGAIVARGDKLGEVAWATGYGSTYFVHFALVRENNERDGVEAQDPTPFIVGCFSSTKSYPDEELVLTYPVVCDLKWYSLREHRKASALDQTYVFVQAARGPTDWVGIAGRGLVRKLRREWGLRPAALWEASVGSGVDGEVHELRAMGGITAGHRSASLGLFLGLGQSRFGDAISSAIELPAEAVFRISRPGGWGQVWVRTTWILGESPRDRGSSLRLFGSDEFVLGAGFRVPTRSPWGLFLGATYEERANDRGFSLLIGTSIDGLF